ncbi:KAP family P-loop NTPase fold protein [Cerasicoccus arenae]|uniref:KAP NTPase domain-containing protein n=1 Tax=Cerasicoccus arenae TaxID=424488 RepID=A0A8J3GEW9_9BACT|nr:P-loop NTPase fold protein [Cerasicoccus arenae]MBK1858208.1 hypothetical protein [Cerasicoccus arenae]GHC01915.1 hypothetical protein GCM10007047_17960 [Cerasicoccus arenae]
MEAAQSLLSSIEDPLSGLNPKIPFHDDVSKDTKGDRLHLANFLKGYFHNENEPSVIALEGTWGSGKSWFLERFNYFGNLPEESVNTVILRAWNHDFCTEPFEPLFSEIYNTLKDKETHLENFQREGGAILEYLLFKAIEIKTLGILKFDEIRKKANDTVPLAKKIASDHQAYIDAVKNFKLALKSVVDETGNHLVIIVDELDRCEPHFALTMLERIKHLFGIPGVHFLIGVATESLASLISGRYGPDVDTDEYLDKFITHRVELYPISQRRFTAKDTFLGNLTKKINKQIGDISEELNITPRRIQRLLHAMQLCFRSGYFYPDDELVPIMYLLLYTKMRSPQLYERVQVTRKKVQIHPKHTIELLLFLILKGLSTESQNAYFPKILNCFQSSCNSSSVINSLNESEYHDYIGYFSGKVAVWDGGRSISDHKVSHPDVLRMFEVMRHANLKL